MVGPIETLNRSIWVVRHLGLPALARAFAAGSLLGFPLISAFYVERIEGFSSLRPLLAFAIVAAWWGRALLLAKVGRDALRLLWSELPIEADFTSSLRLASVVGIGLSLWGFFLVGASYIDVVAIVLALPLLSLRGMIAPSWIARAAAHRDGGLRGFFRAAGDSSDLRFSGLVCELLLLGAWVLVAGNLLALLAALLMVSRGFLGLDIALVDAFLSPSNTFVVLLIIAAAAAMLEPLRVARSAVVYVHAKVIHDGLDLRRALRLLHDGRAAASALLLLASLLAPASFASAQPGTPTAETTDGHPPDSSAEDEPAAPATMPQGDAPAAATNPTRASELISLPIDHEPEHAIPRNLLPSTTSDEEATRQELRTILERDEYAEVPPLPDQHIGEAFQALIAPLADWFRNWLRSMRPQQLPSVQATPIELPTTLLLLVGGLLLGIGLIALLQIVLRKSSRGLTTDEVESETDPLDLDPEEHLDEASRQAGRGLYRKAIRSLYLAALVNLDRHRLIDLDPAKTNGRYLRELRSAASRKVFRELTRLFDRIWYSEGSVSKSDYLRARELATELGHCLATQATLATHATLATRATLTAQSGLPAQSGPADQAGERSER